MTDESNSLGIFDMSINEGQHWIVNSDHAMKMFKEHMDELYAKDKYLVIKWATALGSGSHRGSRRPPGFGAGSAQ